MDYKGIHKELPTITTDKIVLEVIQDLNSRSLIGLNKYKTSLEDSKEDLIAFLNHQYEELLDAALYCKKAIKLLENE
jgi:hypothetical protein